MMKHTQTILAKVCERAYSTMASSRMSSSLKHRWGEQDKFVLFVAFGVGFMAHGSKNYYKRRELWYKVDRMAEENDERQEELLARATRCRDALFMAVRMRNPGASS